jgi:hypothetical protein
MRQRDKNPFGVGTQLLADNVPVPHVITYLGWDTCAISAPDALGPMFVKLNELENPRLYRRDDPGLSLGVTIERVWDRIRAHAGQTFRQISGGEFSYELKSESVISLDRTSQDLSRGVLEKALARWPVTGPGELNDLRAPSYLYALLADPRITGR